MAIETRPWAAAEYLDSKEMILAYFEAVFEDGDPALIADTDIAAVIRTQKALGLELTAKAA